MSHRTAILHLEIPDYLSNSSIESNFSRTKDGILATLLKCPHEKTYAL